MKVFFLLIVTFSLYTFYFFFLGNNKRSSLNKLSISDWMNMERKSRMRLDQKHKLYIMHKKKDMVDKIRKEYISYKKSLIK